MRRLLVPALAFALIPAAPAAAKPLKAPSGVAFYKPNRGVLGIVGATAADVRRWIDGKLAR